MQIEKVDSVTYHVNDHLVFKSWRLGRWICDCESWIYNHKYGEKGDCKHIQAVRENK